MRKAPDTSGCVRERLAGVSKACERLAGVRMHMDVLDSLCTHGLPCRGVGRDQDGLVVVDAEESLALERVQDEGVLLRERPESHETLLRDRERERRQ